jgi:aminopeptidase-like protein
MANDNLSGMILWILLLQYLKSKNTKFSYRFLIMPETIGTISYLSKNQYTMSNVIGGFVLTCVGGPGELSYKSTFLETHLIDKIVTNTLSNLGIKFKKFPFVPRGSDERQFSSPGFRIPIGLLCKDKFHEYENYHTSLDNLEFISESSLLLVFSLYVKIIDALEQTTDLMFNTKNFKTMSEKTNFPIFKSLNPNCEPMLSKRNLYPTIGGSLKQIKSEEELVSNNKENLDLLLNILFYSDGNTPIEHIAIKSGLSENEILMYSKYLVKLKLLKEND